MNRSQLFRKLRDTDEQYSKHFSSLSLEEQSLRWIVSVRNIPRRNNRHDTAFRNSRFAPLHANSVIICPPSKYRRYRFCLITDYSVFPKISRSLNHHTRACGFSVLFRGPLRKITIRRNLEISSTILVDCSNLRMYKIV